MACELCGKKADLQRVIVEGTEMSACPDCAKLGRILPNQQRTTTVKTKSTAAEPIEETIVADAAKRIKDAREKMKLTQEEFAKILNERESVLRKIETHEHVPSIADARRYEHILKIKLIEIEKTGQQKLEKKQSGILTIGDIIKIK